MLLQNFQHATSFLLGSNIEILLYVCDEIRCCISWCRLQGQSPDLLLRVGWEGVFNRIIYIYISVYVCVCVSFSEKYHVF